VLPFITTVGYIKSDNPWQDTPNVAKEFLLKELGLHILTFLRLNEKGVAYLHYQQTNKDGFHNQEEDTPPQ
jgi:hypothetical protein